MSQELHHRYPGIKPFTTAERNLFFGREKDIEDLYRLIFIKQTVVLYGKSGYGKSSLLNAGVIPRLQEEGEWNCLSIRFNNFSERDVKKNVSPVANVIMHLKQKVNPATLLLLNQVLPDEYSLWYWVKACQPLNGHLQMIFFFDQFEEMFTYPRAQIDEFSEQLSQVLYNTVPVKFRKRLAEMDDEKSINDELHAFIYDKPEVKIVFSVRSDRLSLMNYLTDRHPTILQNFFELDALGRSQAQQAIENPALAPASLGFASPGFTYTKDAIEKILENIASPQDGKIESSTLQIICRYVEDELVTHLGHTSITAVLLGDIADIFRQYYEGVLNKLTPIEREKAQRLIEDELIEEGRRNTLTDIYIKSRFGFNDNLLQILEASSLLRKERDATGRTLYEVSHDTLVKAIERVAAIRREAEEQRRRIVLEESLAEERNKAEYLTALNKKVVLRSRIAIALAIVSLIIAGIALRYFLVSQRAKNDADEARIAASRQERRAKVALFESNLQKAKYLVEDVRNSYILSNDYELALKNLDKAESLVSVNFALPPFDQSERNSLLSAIREERKNCQPVKN